ncbi:MAG: phosphoserine phosphatase SerB [Burkholderiales bacterium]|nr:phosphoserine phosphatase SerB [Burkholderiales bacterium]OJX05943.1 MAG: phosphoserine phosphatase SerB [Burkholderiales bacterium 70-64]
MSRLVVQHPHLGDHAVAAFRAALGRAPTLHLPQLAVWEPATLDGDRVGELADALGVDAEIVPMSARLSDYRLLAFDMDSTLITIECIDEIADYAGRKAEVAAITEAAMRGEIANFEESLRRRVALLEGLPATVLARVYEERVRLSPGADALIVAARAAGLKMLLVSGGFTYFTERLAPRLGIDFSRANLLEIAHGRLTGRVLGEVVDAEVKRRVLEETCAAIGCTPAQAIVVGDGANDLKMMSVAGVSVAYRAKPRVRTETTHAINHCGLDAILNWFVDQLPAAP